MPEVPRKGDPVSVSINLNNPGPGYLPVSYELYANNQKVKSGSVVLDPLSTAPYSFNYITETELGDQTTFLVKANTPEGEFAKTASVPAYAPQIWSSFVSFASFSTSIMGSMTTMIYYQDSFLQNPGVQVGIVFALVLLALLIFREVTAVVRHRALGDSLASLRFKFATVAAILLIIFVGMIFTKIIMVLT